ncbi:MAG: hypothetical protein V3V20_12510, partial [Algisphaera sp.]
MPHSDLLQQLLESYAADDRTTHIGAVFLPSRARCIEWVELLRKATFPGFFEPTRLTQDNIQKRTVKLLADIDVIAYEQIRQTERYLLTQRGEANAGDHCPQCDVVAREKTDAFMREMPEVRRKLALDVQAAFDGDP